ncbi:MAG: Na+/H+ antiporter NhaC family protein [Clostridia bacterium]|nr:Na+/H+ antiporter NhaC family protein [Clostridia bacterium]
MKKGNPAALLPIGVFLLMYLGLGLLLQYGMGIDKGFYCVPIIGAFLVAILAACLQNRKVSFDEKLTIMGRGVGDKDIITMVLIFLVAGAFVGVVGRSSAQSVAYFMLSVIAPQFALAVLFVVGCFISTAMGTSVGTISLLTPIAVEVAVAAGYSPALCIGTVVGGAMFGDNLSVISDTTIAACNGQGCAMKDKFRGNFLIALPAAVMTLVIILVLTARQEAVPVVGEYDLMLMLPYMLVLVGGVAGVNVFVVLLVGIVSGAAMVLLTGAIVPAEGQTVFSQLLANLGSGMSGMFETAMVAVLVAALCALIREAGGFDALLNFIRRIFRGKRGGQLGVGMLVMVMDVATANNTVAIVMANPIAREMSEEYGVTPQRTACLLDTFSCITQGVLPYGAQLLTAVAAAEATGVTAFDIIPNLHYPMMLLICSLVAIAFTGMKKRKNA